MAFAQQLNDTGQITCYDSGSITGTVSIGTPAPEMAGFYRQDCTQGRAAADALRTLTKQGDSNTPGRDYTKIANDGSELAASATLGSNPSDWGCTRDNVTGLIWEIKTDDAGLRDKDNTYTWYDTDTAVNGGTPGTANGGTCVGSNCDTTSFRNAVNLAGLCAATDWRLPTTKELQSLIDYGPSAGPLIDLGWFPNTPSAIFWSGQNYAPNASNAWSVYFNYGFLFANVKYTFLQVRLVRGGQ